MGRLASSDLLGAARLARKQGLTGGPYYGTMPPKLITGTYIDCPGYGWVSGTVSTTINRCYYVPWPIFETHTFSAVTMFNSGAGDNGEKIRVMFFNDDGAIGGPGTLAKDFGEITLTGASALRTLTTSWTAPAGMYWAAMWFDSASDMFGMAPYTVASAVGVTGGFMSNHAIGSFAASAPYGVTGTMSAAHYVDTAYGAAPATAVAPTTTAAVIVGSTTAVVPALRLKA